jgi:hypothetical protein
MEGSMKSDWEKLGLGVLIGLLIFTLGTLLYFIFRNIQGGEQAQLPVLLIAGVILLILALTIVSMIFSLLGLTNKEQAMGLPDGSIRSVIAISLILLFAILSVFLYDGIKYGTSSTIEDLSDDARQQFIKDHPAATNIQSSPNKKCILKGQIDVCPPKGEATAANQPLPLFNVTYGSASPTSDDFAKQLLVLLGTLMTAVTSFYLGAGTASQAASVSMPTVTSVDPTTHSIGQNGATIHLQVLGNNLNMITRAKIVRGGVQILGTNVRSNPTSLSCDIAVSQQTTPPDGPWDVVVDDGGSKSAILQGALTITA